MMLYLIGRQGHSLSVINALNSLTRDNRNSYMRCSIDINDTIPSNELGLEVWPNEFVEYFIAIGDNSTRKLIYDKYVDKNKVALPIIHSSAIISDSSIIEEGVFVGANAYIGPNTFIGKHAIINTGSIIEHESKVGSFSHIGPRAVLCGRVECGHQVFLGASATVVPYTKIVDNVTVGAGAVVVNDIIKTGVTVKGVPAR